MRRYTDPRDIDLTYKHIRLSRKGNASGNRVIFIYDQEDSDFVEPSCEYEVHFLVLQGDDLSAFTGDSEDPVRITVRNTLTFEEIDVEGYDTDLLGW